jgi:hypothetical protein
MSGKTGDDRGPQHACARTSQAAACIQIAVAGCHERGERDGRSR